MDFKRYFMAAIAGLKEVIITQVVYMSILGLITYSVKKIGRKQGFLYWFTVSIDILYGLSFGWLFYKYSALGNDPDLQKVFTWSVFSLIFPGILVFLASVVFIAVRLFQKRNKLTNPN
jgi:hypothetical protein